MTRLKAYYYFGWIALLSTLLFHLLTYIPSLRTSYSILIFVFGIAMFPPFIVSTKAGKKYLRQPNSPLKNIWSDYFRYTPKWLKKSFWIVVLYVFFNFFFSLFYLNEGGVTPEIIDGKYVLEYQGKIYKEITEEQYFKHKAYLFRGMSGHSILFHIISISIFTSVFNKKENES